MFDPSNYPRVYTHSREVKITLSLFFGAVAAGICFLMWPRMASDWRILLVCPGVPVLLIGLVLKKFRQRLVLYPDRLEYTDLLTRRVRREDIEYTAVRHTAYDGDVSLWLSLKNNRFIRIETFGSADDAFIDWFDDIPHKSESPEPFDASSYPRTYAEKTSTRIAMCVFSGVAPAGLIALIYYFFKEAAGDYPHHHALALGLAAFAVFAAFALWQLVLGKIVLHADRILFRELLTWRTVMRTDIAHTAGPRSLRLRDGSLVTPPYLPVDSAYVAWFDDFTHEAETFSSNPAFGRDKDERLKTARRLKHWGAWMILPAAAVALWGFVKPDVLCLPFLMAVPVLGWLAVVLSRQRLSIVPDPERVTVPWLIFCLPMLALVWLAYLKLRWMTDGTLILPAVIVAATILTLLVIVADGRSTLVGLAIAFFAAGLYSASGLILLNAVLDISEPRYVPSRVVGKGTLGEGRLYINIEARHGRGEDYDYPVSQQLHAVVRPGDTVCSRYYAGRFGWEYRYRPQFCPDDPRRPPEKH